MLIFDRVYLICKIWRPCLSVPGAPAIPVLLWTLWDWFPLFLLVVQYALVSFLVPGDCPVPLSPLGLACSFVRTSLFVTASTRRYTAWISTYPLSTVSPVAVNVLDALFQTPVTLSDFVTVISTIYVISLNHTLLFIW